MFLQNKYEIEPTKFPTPEDDCLILVKKTPDQLVKKGRLLLTNAIPVITASSLETSQDFPGDRAKHHQLFTPGIVVETSTSIACHTRMAR